MQLASRVACPKDADLDSLTASPDYIPSISLCFLHRTLYEYDQQCRTFPWTVEHFCNAMENFSSLRNCVRHAVAIARESERDLGTVRFGRNPVHLHTGSHTPKLAFSIPVASVVGGTGFQAFKFRPSKRQKDVRQSSSSIYTRWRISLPRSPWTQT